MSKPRRARKSDARDRAKASGFPEKFRAFLSSSRWRDGPRNAAQVAQWLTERGESIAPTGPARWARADSLPDARYIALIERMMGMPWAFLDDPKTAWGEGPDVWDRLAFSAILAFEAGPSERRRLVIAALEAARTKPPA